MNVSIVFIIILVLTFIAAIYALFKKEYRNLVIFISILAIFATLLGVYVSMKDDGDAPEEKHENSHNTTDVKINNGNGIAIAGNTYGNIENNQYNEATDPITLEAAYIKLKMKQYEDAAEIYLKLLLQEPENNVALCNLGYVYACGLDTDIDINEARKYYAKAMLNGSDQALRNWIAMELYNDISVDEYFKFIWYGIKIGDKPICRFIAGSMQEDPDPDTDAAITFCQNLDEIPLDAIFAWEDSGLIKVYSTPTNTNIVQYTKVSGGTETTENAAKMYTIYKEEHRYCPYIDLLNAGFDEQI